MTDTKINIAIAEACGWEKVRAHYEKDGVMAFSNDMFAHRHLPDYCHDLNAMHEAEKALTLAQCVVYAERLCWFKCMDVDRPIEGPQSFIWGATARQRAEAFLRTIGKWKP